MNSPDGGPMTDAGTMTVERLPGPAGKVRSPNGRWPRRRLLTVAAIVTALAAVAIWVIGFSPAFGVRHVRVDGVSGSAANDVVTAASLTHGSPLLRLDTGAVTARVLALPWVAAASTRTDFPSTVVIAVTPRVPVGLVKLAVGYRLVDRNGVQYQTVAKAPAGLPQLTLPTGAAARTTGTAVAAVAGALTTAVRAKVASIQAVDANAITLVLRDGRVVHWGSADRTADKASLLPALLSQRGRVFDVSNPDLVVAH